MRGSSSQHFLSLSPQATPPDLWAGHSHALCPPTNLCVFPDFNILAVESDELPQCYPCFFCRCSCTTLAVAVFDQFLGPRGSILSTFQLISSTGGPSGHDAFAPLKIKHGGADSSTFSYCWSEQVPLRAG